MNFGLLTLFDYYPEDCSPQEYYRFLLDEIAYAEELGFDSVWMGEHHFCNYLCPSPQVFAAAVAQRTTRLRLGTAVALLPLHDPVRLAEPLHAEQVDERHREQQRGADGDAPSR